MRRLSAQRRHPLAGLVVLVLGLLATGGLYTLLAPGAPAEAETTAAREIQAGRDLFLVGCSSCHGLNAEGTNLGPPLIGVGAAAVDFQVGTGRMPLSSPAPQAPRKEPQYTPEETRYLAAYVASLGPGPDIPDPSAYDVSDASAAEIAEGGELFRSNCTACHNFAGSGGVLASGRYAPEVRGTSHRYVYEAMLTGPQQMPVFSDAVITPADKRDIIAYIDHLAEQPSPGGFALGRLGPVTEGLWAWVAGMGALIVVAIWIGTKGVKVK